jgi:hypothetical protein
MWYDLHKKNSHQILHYNFTHVLYDDTWYIICHAHAIPHMHCMIGDVCDVDEVNIALVLSYLDYNPRCVIIAV